MRRKKQDGKVYRVRILRLAEDGLITRVDRWSICLLESHKRHGAVKRYTESLVVLQPSISTRRATNAIKKLKKWFAQYGDTSRIDVQALLRGRDCGDYGEEAHALLSKGKV